MVAKFKEIIHTKNIKLGAPQVLKEKSLEESARSTHVAPDIATRSARNPNNHRTERTVLNLASSKGAQAKRENLLREPSASIVNERKKMAENVVDSDLARRTREQRCRYLKEQRNVIVGQSFGTLSQSEVEEWLESPNCDLFFCKKNQMSGKGRFKCEPLQQLR